jgi:hypothetical protein
MVKSFMKKNIIYIATPYTHAEDRVMEERYQRVTDYAAVLINSGSTVFSPITHCHSIRKRAELPTSWNFWKNYDLEFLSICSEIHVLMVDGWRESIGVKEEIEFAENNGVRVVYIHPKSFTRMSGYDIVHLLRIA